MRSLILALSILAASAAAAPAAAQETATVALVGLE